MARGAAEGAWVVCRGETRLVAHGSVACVAGGRVPLSRCLDCRYLETSSGERTRDRWCIAVLATDSGGLRDGVAELEADRFNARLHGMARPWQTAVLEQGMDRMVLGEHRGFEGDDPATPG